MFGHLAPALYVLALVASLVGPAGDVARTRFVTVPAPVFGGDPTTLPPPTGVGPVARENQRPGTTRWLSPELAASLSRGPRLPARQQTPGGQAGPLIPTCHPTDQDPCGWVD